MASQVELPKDPRRRFGDRGEDLAAAFMEARGYRIVERNWSCKVGEIDVICEKDGVTHFVEVKTRQNLEFGYPEEAITPTKLSHLRRAIEAYLMNRPDPPTDYRVHALAILAVPGEEPKYHFIENILG